MQHFSVVLQEFLKDAAENDRCAQRSCARKTEERRNESKKEIRYTCVFSHFKVLVDTKVSRSGYAILSNIMRRRKR